MFLGSFSRQMSFEPPTFKTHIPYHVDMDYVLAQFIIYLFKVSDDIFAVNFKCRQQFILKLINAITFSFLATL